MKTSTLLSLPDGVSVPEGGSTTVGDTTYTKNQNGTFTAVARLAGDETHSGGRPWAL